ncbi:MAG TPA: NAD(P)/FAD-dependent oxidoreductase, partial [Gaiellaceae bacterium]
DGGDRHRVVVIGSGFGGLFGTKALRRADVDVTMVAKTTHHLFQPLLYQVATGILSEGEIAPPTREVLASQKNARVILGEVTDIDLEKRLVTSRVLNRETVTPYDSLIVAAGAGQSYFGNDHFSEFAPGMKSIDDALELRGRIFGAFELAELSEDEDEIQRLLTFVVVGAGPTGVEMAGQIAELAHDTLHHDFRSVDTATARVLLLEAGERILPAFPESLSRKAEQALERLGVTVLTGHTVVGVAEGSVAFRTPAGDEEHVAARTAVWAAGVTASPLASMLALAAGADADRVGRISVGPDLTVPGHPEVLALGDMVGVLAPDGTPTPLPGVAPVAMQQGRYAARAIRARLDGRAPDAFRYRDKGNLATIGRSKAVADVKGLHVAGLVAWMLWLVVHLFYLIGFQNRLLVVLRWTISFVTRGRGARLILEPTPPAEPVSSRPPPARAPRSRSSPSSASRS